MHPILFRIGDFYIGTYGLFVAAGLLAGVFTAAARARRNGIDPNLVLDTSFIVIIAAMLGARLTYILVNFPDFLEYPRHYILSRTGFVFSGGLIAGALGGAWLLRRRGAPMWRFGDILAPSIALGHGLGRIGCFFAGCCWGKVCELPWAAKFPAAYGPRGEALGFVYEEHRLAGLLETGATHSLPVHPTQLYEAGALLALFVALSWLFRRRRFDGQVFCAYLILYAILRFGLEFFRGDLERGVYLHLSTSQWISLALVAVGAWLWTRRRSQPLSVTAPAPPKEKTG